MLTCAGALEHVTFQDGEYVFEQAQFAVEIADRKPSRDRDRWVKVPFAFTNMIVTLRLEIKDS